MGEKDRKRLDEIADGLLDSVMVFSRRLAKHSPRPGGRKFDPSLFVLKKVGEIGLVSMSEVGRHMEISKPYMTMLVDKLIGEGLVERVTDPKDRRVVRIRITSAGRSVLSEFTKEVRESIILRLSALSPEDISSLHESMKNMRSIISKLDHETEVKKAHGKGVR